MTTTEFLPTLVTPGTAGRFYVTEGGAVVGGPFRSEAEAADFAWGPQDPPSCSVCDAFGHGYPGGGPCPLEETGEDDLWERELWALEDALR